MNERARSGEIAQIARDPDAFEAFYREHLDAVQRFVVRRVHDPYLTADLTADVFLAAIDSAHTYRPTRGEPVTWLYGLARNVVAAEHRRSAREPRAASRIPTPARRWSSAAMTLPPASGFLANPAGRRRHRRSASPSRAAR